MITVDKMLEVAAEFADIPDMPMAYLGALAEIVRLREVIEASVEYHGHWNDCAECRDMMKEYQRPHVSA